MSHTYTRYIGRLLCVASLAWLLACSRSIETSVAEARLHAASLVGVAAADVEELQKGMPQGALQLRALYQASVAPKDDLQSVRQQLDRVRNHVQDLRVAKSTFFFVAERDGTILRGDREPDLLSGKNLFAPFPETRQSLEGKAVATRGDMPEAAVVKGRRDGQFVVSVPILVDGVVSALYVSGWSWAAYAYRLQNALTSEVRGKKKGQEKDPLMYVYLVVDDAVLGAPTAPEVNAQAIGRLSPLSKVNGDEVFSSPLEITGRDFGVAIKRAPSLGQNVAIAVLRSET